MSTISFLTSGESMDVLELVNSIFLEYESMIEYNKEICKFLTDSPQLGNHQIIF